MRPHLNWAGQGIGKLPPAGGGKRERERERTKEKESKKVSERESREDRMSVRARVCGWPSASVQRQWLQSQREGRGLAVVVSLIDARPQRSFLLFFLSSYFEWWCVKTIFLLLARWAEIA